jgi:hypothetical protein
MADSSAQDEPMELEEAGASTAPIQSRARKEGDDVGVYQVPSGKWHGSVSNPLKKGATGKPKYEHTQCFATKAEAIAARKELQARLDAEYWSKCTALAKADPTTKDLPLGPEDPADAEPNKAYWRPNKYGSHLPFCAMRRKSGRGGFQWIAACVECAADAVGIALPDGKGGKATHCLSHGGGCAHGANPHSCFACLSEKDKDTRTFAKFCNRCAAVPLSTKRLECYGGNGLCAGCEKGLKAEAAEAGSSTAPPKSKRWEDVFLDKLVTLVTDTEGNVITCEARDDLSNMLGSDKRRRKGQCSTDHQRRPDIYWLVRDAESRIVAAVFVEVDEYSHSDRDPACEAGKIDETFQAILKLAQEEGKGRLAETRTGTIRTPFVAFLKVNPNACDAEGGPFSLDVRIGVVAERVRRLLNADPAYYHSFADMGKTTAPYVQCFFYHSKQGAKNLAYFDAHAEGAWHYAPNYCSAVQGTPIPSGLRAVANKEGGAFS